MPRWATFFRSSLTPFAAIRRIAAVTLAVALADAMTTWTFDSDEFPTLGSAPQGRRPILAGGGSHRRRLHGVVRRPAARRRLTGATG